MPFRHARELLDYWCEVPPENEMLVTLAQIYTTWRPRPPTTAPSAGVVDEAEHQRLYRAELEKQWASGAAVNLKQLHAAAGGGVSPLGGTAKDPADMPGIGRFPGAPPK